MSDWSVRCLKSEWDFETIPLDLFFDDKGQDWIRPYELPVAVIYRLAPDLKRIEVGNEYEFELPNDSRLEEIAKAYAKERKNCSL